VICVRPAASAGRKAVAGAIVGAETGLREVMQRVKLVTRSDVSVLLLGETGTGKEVIARAIHTQSPRAAHPFLRVNCGAIPAQLIDSELFGHERGAFTGATETRAADFISSNGGGLFERACRCRDPEKRNASAIAGRHAIYDPIRVILAA